VIFGLIICGLTIVGAVFFVLWRAFVVAKDSSVSKEEIQKK
jgi:hypothetical protein